MSLILPKRLYSVTPLPPYDMLRQQQQQQQQQGEPSQAPAPCQPPPPTREEQLLAMIATL